MSPTFDLATIVVALGAVTFTFMQALGKPLLEKLIPGIMLPVNQGLHDNLIRFVQYAINLGLMIAVARFGGATLFANWHWWDFLFATFLPAGASQIAYAYGSQGGSEPAEPTPAKPATLVVSTHLTDPAGGAIVPALQPTDIPVVPRQ